MDLSKATICKLWSLSSRRLGIKVPEEFQDSSVSQVRYVPVNIQKLENIHVYGCVCLKDVF